MRRPTKGRPKVDLSAKSEVFIFGTSRGLANDWEMRCPIPQGIEYEDTIMGVSMLMRADGQHIHSGRFPQCCVRKSGALV